MLEDLMGNMQTHQEAMQKKLKSTVLNYCKDGITIEMNAAKEILDIEISDTLMKSDRKEELQDLLIVHMNNALKKAEEVQEKESSSVMKNLLPGGLGSMFGI
jgi:DNA-binding YbaB/EbfC family protein